MRRFARICNMIAVNLLFTLFLVASDPARAADVRWRGGALAAATPRAANLQAALADLAARPSERHLVVQFTSPVLPGQRAALRAAGLTLLSYLGDHAHFAAFTGQGVDPKAIAAVNSLADVQAIQRSWKLHPAILQDEYPTYARAVDPASSRDMAAAYVMFHPDTDLGVQALAIGERHGATVVSSLASLNVLVVELPYASIAALADEDAVQWIEPPLPFMTETNSSNRVITQADQVQAAPYNLDGSGVNVLVYDGGFGLASHGDFGGRLTVRDSSGLSDHSTHVAGTIGGDGSGSGGVQRGMAPAVIMESYGFDFDGSGIFLYSNPGDIEADYNQAINTFGVHISNNSIGTNTEPNGFNCAIQGDYGVTSALIDSIVRGSLGAPFRIVWAAGNERQGSRCDVEGFGDYYSTAPPSGAKNHIAVGAINSNNESMTSFSSWGPTDDGRLKPDICGPGCQSSGDFGVTSTSSSGGYTVKCGTSMASPTVCGLAALMLQDLRTQFPGQQADPRNSTLKALLAHNAVDLGNPGPDYQFGYGSVRVRDTIDHMRGGDAAFQEGQVDQSGVASFQVTVAPGTSELKITLAWDDSPGTPNVNPALVNDLDLWVLSPSAQQAFPWTLNPLNPSFNAVRTRADHVNNIEQVVVDAPEAGTWSVEVRGFNIPDGPQSFSICSNPSIMTIGIHLSLPNGTPDIILPNTSTQITVEIVAFGESLIPGSPTLHFRFDGGAYLTTSLTPLGGDLYEGALAPTACSDMPEYYFSAEGTLSGVVTLPTAAPVAVFSAVVGEVVTLFDDDFEIDTGWTAENLGAVNGDWQRGVPVNDPAWSFDPESDSDGSGQCYLTQNAVGNTDIDAGVVRITSPAIDMSAGNVTIQYDYFLRLTDDDGTDRLLVEIDSNDGAGPWAEIARHDTNGGLDWRSHVIEQADLDAAGVTLTSTMRLRITANDSDPQSIVEAALDAVRVTRFQCVGAPPDCNGNGTPDDQDIAGGTSPDCDTNGVPDECQTDSDSDGTIDPCDGCPSDPNKTDPGQCGCGNPDTDFDNDGTADCNDGCPNDPNKTAPGICGCAVPDDDGDSDGTPDCNDGCPNDPNKTTPGICGCGVSDADSDSDGTADCNDGCPNDPNKTDPGACGCGVPNDDGDSDGTPDCNDGCPNDPNKTEPGECGCGSPETASGSGDVNGDGIVNGLDIQAFVDELLTSTASSLAACAADMNTDGTVTADDIALLVAALVGT